MECMIVKFDRHCDIMCKQKAEINDLILNVVGKKIVSDLDGFPISYMHVQV